MNKSIIMTILVILDALTTIITNTNGFLIMFSWHYQKNGGGTPLFGLVIFMLRELPYLCSIFWTEIGSVIKIAIKSRNREKMALLLCLFLLFFV